MNNNNNTNAVKKGLIDIECYAYEIKEITLDEFLITQQCDIEYDSLPNYIYNRVMFTKSEEYKSYEEYKRSLK